VFRHRIRADESASVDALIADLRLRLDQTTVSPPLRALAIAEADTVLRQFVDNGRKLSSLGSRFQASRDIKGDGYAIHIAFAPVASKGWLSRLLGR
jgi:hypothetical protein